MCKSVLQIPRKSVPSQLLQFDAGIIIRQVYQNKVLRLILSIFDSNLQPQPSYSVNESGVDISTLLTASEVPFFNLSNSDNDETFESLLNDLGKGQ